MTLVVTHTEGFLGCFTVNPDGSMRQRALIDTGDEKVAPQELAETGMVLAQTYGWQLNGALPTPAPEPVALPEPSPKVLKPATQQRKKNRTPYVHRSYPPNIEKQAMILNALLEHPASTLSQCLQHMGQPDDSAARSNWHHTFNTLRSTGKISYQGKGTSADPYRYSIVK